MTGQTAYTSLHMQTLNPAWQDEPLQFKLTHVKEKVCFELLVGLAPYLSDIIIFRKKTKGESAVTFHLMVRSPTFPPPPVIPDGATMGAEPGI